MKKPQFEKVQMLPFWKPEEEGEQIEGVVQNLHEIESNYGKQMVCDIGDYSVGISAGLAPLTNLVGQYVRLTYQGEVLNEKTGRTFRSYLIEKAVL